jgi:hypothetical protein
VIDSDRLIVKRIVSTRWRRVTFIVTSGDRFTYASEINDLFVQEGPAGQLYVRLKELGIPVEREWWIDDEGTAYVVDLALPVGDGWLSVIFGDRPGPAGGLRFSAEDEPEIPVKEIQARLGLLLDLVAVGLLRPQGTVSEGFQADDQPVVPEISSRLILSRRIFWYRRDCRSSISWLWERLQTRGDRLTSYFRDISAAK